MTEPFGQIGLTRLRFKCDRTVRSPHRDAIRRSREEPVTIEPDATWAGEAVGRENAGCAAAASIGDVRPPLYSPAGEENEAPGCSRATLVQQSGRTVPHSDDAAGGHGGGLQHSCVGVIQQSGRTGLRSDGTVSQCKTVIKRRFGVT
jgi:hypothetical protein